MKMLFNLYFFSWNSSYSYYIGKSSVIEIIFNMGINQSLQKQIDDLTHFHWTIFISIIKICPVNHNKFSTWKKKYSQLHQGQGRQLQGQHLKIKNKSCLKFHSMFVAFFSIFAICWNTAFNIAKLHASMIPHTCQINNILKIISFQRNWFHEIFLISILTIEHPFSGTILIPALDACMHTGCWDWQVWTVSDPCQLMNGYRLMSMGWGQRSKDSLTRE